ncbi:MAG: CocE/NonD family hydrolase [Alphaproteobacteria bacterium]|nr:CocE/NonD family hydrolase [Alphaproteobacteria bacterium]
MQIVTQFPRVVRDLRNVWIPLADGTRLAARIWLPEDAAADPVPAILEYIPYRKHDGTGGRDVPMHAYLAGHGYGCVRVDIRGSGESDGLLSDEYLKGEQDDAVEVIAWIARQPWCTGAVGMTGISWGGFNALQVAARRPPALKAIITHCSTDERYDGDVHYIGGCLSYDNIAWGSAMLAIGSQPPAPDIVGEGWRAMWLERLENATLLTAHWMRRQRRDSYWRQGSVCEDFAAITCAVYAVGGWADGYASAVGRLLAGLTCPRKGLIGPWAHKFPHAGVPGPAIGWLQEALRWWDHWLKGRDTGIMAEPSLRAWMQESVPPRVHYAERPGRWVAEESWPSPNIRPLRLFLDPGTLDDKAGPSTNVIVRTPQTLGATAGEWCPYGYHGEHPADQREDDGRSICFDSAPLADRIEMLGAPVVTLTVTADKPVAFLAVRLCDVAPDGASTRVSYKALNLTRRDGLETAKPIEPGRPMTVAIMLYDLGYVFPAGHRIRLAVSTTMWPLIWPAPEAPTVTLTTGASFLDLPVRAPRPSDAALPDFAEPECGPPAPISLTRPDQRRRRVERDLNDGSLVMRYTRDWGAERHADIDLLTSSIGQETYRIVEDAPLSARQSSSWTVILERGTWKVRTESRTTVTSTAGAFRVVATLDAYEGETRVLSRSWDETILRDLM